MDLPRCNPTGVTMSCDVKRFGRKENTHNPDQLSMCLTVKENGNLMTSATFCAFKVCHIMSIAAAGRRGQMPRTTQEQLVDCALPGSQSGFSADETRWCAFRR